MSINLQYEKRLEQLESRTDVLIGAVLLLVIWLGAFSMFVLGVMAR